MKVKFLAVAVVKDRLKHPIPANGVPSLARAFRCLGNIDDFRLLYSIPLVCKWCFFMIGRFYGGSQVETESINTLCSTGPRTGIKFLIVLYWLKMALETHH